MLIIGTNTFVIAVLNPLIMLLTAVAATLPAGIAPKNTLPRYRAILGLKR